MEEITSLTPAVPFKVTSIPVAVPVEETNTGEDLSVDEVEEVVEIPVPRTKGEKNLFDDLNNVIAELKTLTEKKGVGNSSIIETTLLGNKLDQIIGFARVGKINPKKIPGISKQLQKYLMNLTRQLEAVNPNLLQKFLKDRENIKWFMNPDM